MYLPKRNIDLEFPVVFDKVFESCWQDYQFLGITGRNLGWIDSNEFVCEEIERAR